MRIFAAALAACAIVVSAFVLGRTTATQVAEAQFIPFSHFQCYQTNTPTTFKGIHVVLTDQFGTTKTVLQRPNLFCAPVKKQLVNMKPHLVKGAADHLLCYPEETTSKTLVRQVENQLGFSTIRDLKPQWLCVPTHKYETSIKMLPRKK